MQSQYLLLNDYALTFNQLRSTVQVLLCFSVLSPDPKPPP